MAAAAVLATLWVTAASGFQPPGGAAPTGAPPDEVIPELEAFEGRRVHAVVLRTVKHDENSAEPPPLTAEVDSLVRNQLRTREGAPYYQKIASEDITRLNRLGRFKRVESRVQLLSNGGVNVIFLLAVQPVVQAVHSVGNRAISDEDIDGLTNLLVGTPVDQLQLEKFARRIEDRYREKGYYNAKVTVDQSELEKTGVVLYKVREGDRSKVVDIRFNGNISFSEVELKKNLKTKEAWLLGKGRLDDDDVAMDVSVLIEYYRDRGYIDARADREIRPSPNGREAIVTFLISEGQLYTLRSVRVEYGPEDAQKISPAQVVGLMSLKAGDVYAEDKLRKSIQAIRDAYGTMGYADARVGYRELRDPTDPFIDLRIDIREGSRYRTGEVIVRNNPTTDRKVILREVRVQPDRPLDTTAVAETERRLRMRNLFAPPGPTTSGPRVTIQPPDEFEPDHRDVLVEVEETNTGSFAMGATVGSDGGVGARIEITQRNFDVTDTPDTFGELFTGEAFKGGGQTFSIQILPGDRQQTFAVRLYEPALMESDYSGSFRAFLHRRDYRIYTEQRAGLGLSVGRRFGSRWIGEVPIRIEGIDLSSLRSDAPRDYYDVRDANLLTSVGVSLSRRTTDDEYRPTKGMFTSVELDQVGSLGGSFTYTSVAGEYDFYVPLSADLLGRSTTLRFTSKARYVPQSIGEVPVFERFFMGGANFRGFDYRGVSPRGVRNDTGELGRDPVGGNFSFFAGVEVQQPLYDDILAGVVFLDTGTVNTRFSFDHYRVSTGFGIRLIVPQLSPIPLAFDFGFPLIKEASDDRRLFTFSIDVPFR